jgi:hypothetical protein
VRSHRALIDDRLACRSDRTDRIFRVPGSADLAGDRHVELRAERGSHFNGDRNSPASHPENEEVAVIAVAGFIQCRGQSLPGLGAIAVAHGERVPVRESPEPRADSRESRTR